MKIQILFGAMFIMATLAACKKEASKETEKNFAGTGTTAVTARLTASAWKFSGVILRYDDGTTDNDLLDICKSEDLYQYEINGDATVTYGPIPCSQDPANGIFASWELIDNATKLKEVYTRDMLGETAGNTVIYNVDFINDNKLVISRTVVEPGKTYTEINTYRR
jgi:hypothetical protein